MIQILRREAAVVSEKPADCFLGMRPWILGKYSDFRIEFPDAQESLENLAEKHRHSPPQGKVRCLRGWNYTLPGGQRGRRL